MHVDQTVYIPAWRCHYQIVGDLDNDGFTITGIYELADREQEDNQLRFLESVYGDSFPYYEFAIGEIIAAEINEQASIDEHIAVMESQQLQNDRGYY